MTGRIYRIAPELRRSAVIIMVGCVLLACASHWIGQFSEFEPERAVPMYILFGAGFLAMFVPLRWAVRVDEIGIARRRLIGWDRWSWGDFASGRIEKRHPYTFADPQGLWWFRTLNIGYVADAERKELMQLVNEHYRLPDPPPLPEMLELTIGLQKLELSGHENRFTRSGKTIFFTWSDVMRVRITRADPLRRDFHQLILFLPDDEIKLGRHEGEPRWRGADAEVVNGFLLAHVPADRIDVDIMGERPARREDVQMALDGMKSDDRAIQVVAIGASLLFAVFFVWMAVERHLLFAIVMLAMGWVPPVAILWGIHRRRRKRAAQLQAWLSEFENEGAAASHARW